MKHLNLDVLLVICLSLTSTWAQNIQVRLEGGNGTNQGRVEVQYNGVWGTVCDDYWSDLDSAVVCRSLGLPFTGAIGLSWAYFGEGTGTILMDDVQCVGNESSLDQCNFNGWAIHNCDHYEDASVICHDDTSPDIQVRLAGSNKTNEGRVEVQIFGLWGTICSDQWYWSNDGMDWYWSDDGTGRYWSDANAAVVCRSLGLPFTGAVGLRFAYFGRGDGITVMANVQCVGNESSLAQCKFNGWAKYECDHYYDVSVICHDNCSQVPIFPQGYVQAVDPSNTTYAALAYVICNLGYSPSMTEITCTKTAENDTWQIPVCLRDCGQVPTIADGYVEAVDPANTTYGALANVICNICYNSTVTEITCTENGTWQIPLCLANASNPTFPAQTVAYSIPETTAVSTPVASVTFSDLQKADDLPLSLTSSTPSGYFVLLDNGDGTGTITTHAITTLTAVSGQTVIMNFLATNICGLTVSGSVTIHITNDPPKLINLPLSTDVSEDMLVQTTIATFTCTDSSGSVSVSSTESPSNVPNADFFFTKFVSGNVYSVMARAQVDATQGTFNYNTQSFYDITVTCSDSIDNATAVIRADLVPNSPPVINNLPAGTTISVPQAEAVGTVVFTLTFTDADGDPVTFSQTWVPVNCPFIVLDSGQVQVKSSIYAYSEVEYDIFITPSDGKDAGIQRTLTINITDINDIPKYTNLNNSVVVDENTVIGTTVFTVSYTDTDLADTHTFFMTNSDSGTSYFDISPTGEISTKAAINYEVLSVKIFPFTIVISDGRASATATLTVTIADVNEPLSWNFATYSTDELEQTAVGTTLTEPGFAITDPDAGDTYACAMDCGGSNGYFAMNTTCQIRVSSSYSLDAGLANTVTCTVTAVDKGDHTATTTLIINILHANNYKPVFSNATYQFTISPYANADAAIGTIDSAGLILTQVNMPDICNCSDITFAVPVLATDTGGLVGTATVYITVLAVTTTTAKTTTDRTFFDDTKNIAWVSVIMVALAITFVTAFVCAKYLCKPSAERRKITSRPSDVREVRDPPKRIEPENHKPKPTSVIFVRPPPQLRGIQSWGSKPLFKRY